MGTGPTGWGCHLCQVTAGPALTNLVLREQGRTRGNAALGVFQASLMNGGRKMENFSFLWSRARSVSVPRGTPRTKPGDSFRTAPGPILSPSLHYSVPVPGLAQQGTQCHPFIWPHSAWPGLLWDFSFPFLSFFCFFSKISMLDLPRRSG